MEELMRVRHWRALLFGIVAVFAVIPANASAATFTVTSQGVTYTCGPKPSDLAMPPPNPPPAPAAVDYQSHTYPEICPQGYLPVLPTNDAPKPEPPISRAMLAQQEAQGDFKTQTALEQTRKEVTQSEATNKALPLVDPTGEELGGSLYWHAQEESTWPWTEETEGLWTWQTQEAPIVDTSETGGHSLGQLWANDDSYGWGERSDVETGWMRWAGCSHTYIFLYHFDKGQADGYNTGFHQESNKQVPSTECNNGTPMGTDDNFHEFGIQRYGENWWVYHDGEWIGYYPKSSFPRYFFYGLIVGQAGGEVNEPLWDYYPYTQMGNGQFGNSGTAAIFKEVWRYPLGKAGVYLNEASSWATEPSRYSVGRVHEYGTGDFRYGGPGWT
jgi:Neprosin